MWRISQQPAATKLHATKRLFAIAGTCGRASVPPLKLERMELEFIRWLRAHVPTDPRAKLGLSDDAALVSLAGRNEVVVTTDLLTDAVDFELGKHAPQRIGRQALAANLSDLAAMAAKPLAAFVSIALPRTGGANLSATRLGDSTLRRPLAARRRI